MDELKQKVDEIFEELVKISQVNEFILLTNKVQEIRLKLDALENGTKTALTSTATETTTPTVPVEQGQQAPVVQPAPTEEVAA